MKRWISLLLVFALLPVVPVRAETIKWVDFQVGTEALELAMETDIRTAQELQRENERYELPAKSFLSETVLLHCIRAFAAADKRGKHGLLLMGISASITYDLPLPFSLRS